MKTTDVNSEKMPATIIIGIIVMAMILMTTSLSFAQRINIDEYAFQTIPVSDYEFTSFNCKYANGAVYVIWTSIEKEDGVIYKLERSLDMGKTYKSIFAVVAGKSPANQELMYSHSDKDVLTTPVYYRIKRVTKDRVLVSNIKEVNDMKIISDVISLNVEKETLMSVEAEN